MTGRGRIAFDAAISIGTFLALAYAGAGLWAWLIVPFGLWQFHDGFERATAKHERYLRENSTVLQGTDEELTQLREAIEATIREVRRQQSSRPRPQDRPTAARDPSR